MKLIGLLCAVVECLQIKSNSITSPDKLSPNVLKNLSLNEKSGNKRFRSRLIHPAYLYCMPTMKKVPKTVDMVLSQFMLKGGP